jgi:hypothetical protein
MEMGPYCLGTFVVRAVQYFLTLACLDLRMGFVCRLACCLHSNTLGHLYLPSDLVFVELETLARRMIGSLISSPFQLTRIRDSPGSLNNGSV